MQQVVPGQANKVTLDMVARATGSAIIAGTVTFYLRARTGTNAGKWFRASDSTWQAAEASSGTAGYIGGPVWELSIVTAAWAGGTTYDLYGKESGNLQIDYSEPVITWSPPTTGVGTIEWDYVLTDSVSLAPIPNAEVWISTDLAGDNIVAYGLTNLSGSVTFFLDAGTVYVWRRHPSYSFDNPDTEVVS